MNDRERFLACVLGEPVDRPPYWLYWGPWRTTWERWRREGMPEEFTDFSKARAQFDPDSRPEAIDRELERVAPAVAAGRYIPDLDHVIPDDVSYENYCYYARRLNELVGKD